MEVNGLRHTLRGGRILVRPLPASEAIRARQLAVGAFVCSLSLCPAAYSWWGNWKAGWSRKAQAELLKRYSKTVSRKMFAVMEKRAEEDQVCQKRSRVRMCES